MKRYRRYNEAMLNWKAEYSSKRYARRVSTSKLVCQECGGSGTVVEDGIDFGDDWCGPIMFYLRGSCGWCQGTGKLTPWLRGQWLKFRREIKRDKNLNAKTPCI